RKGLAFSPDLVLVHFVGNDFNLPHFMQPAGSPPGPSYLLDFLRRRFRRQEAPDLLHDLKGLPQEVRRETRVRYKEMVGVEAYRRAMARLPALHPPRHPPA